MKQVHPLAIIFIGYMVSLSGFLTMTATFLVAFFNDYRIVINVNRYGEAQIEFILIPIVLSIILMGLIKTYRLLFYEVEVEV